MATLTPRTAVRLVRMWVISAGIGALSCTSFGCDDTPAAVDGGTDEAATPDGSGLADSLVVAIDPVLPANLTPCPAGFVEQTRAGATWCAPFGGRRHLSCPPGQAHFIGGDACEPVGKPCSQPSAEPADRPLVWVAPRTSGATTGIGTRDEPLTSLVVAEQLVGEDGVIELLPGEYFDQVVVSHRLEIRGSCAERTRLLPVRSRAAIWVGPGGELTLRDITIGPGEQANAVFAQEWTVVRVRDSVIVGTGASLSAGIVTDGDLEVEHSLFAGNDPLAIRVSGAGTATIRRVVSEKGRGFADNSSSGSMTVEDTVVDDPSYIAFENSVGSLDVRRSFVFRSGTVVSNYAQLSVSDSLFDGGALGGGGILTRGTSGRMERTAVFSMGEAGLIAHGGELELADVIVANTASVVAPDVDITGTEPEDVFVVRTSVGVSLFDLQGSARRLQLLDNESVGIDVAISNVAIEDLHVAGTRSEPTYGVFGHGAVFYGEADSEVTVDRAEFERNREVGVFILGQGTTMSNVRVVDVDENQCTRCGEQRHGHGVAITEGSASLERFEIRGAAACGAILFDANLMLRDGSVSHNEAGLCTDTVDLDFEALMQNVRYVENHVNLASEQLPVPHRPQVAVRPE